MNLPDVVLYQGYFALKPSTLNFTLDPCSIPNLLCSNQSSLSHSNWLVSTSNDLLLNQNLELFSASEKLCFLVKYNFDGIDQDVIADYATDFWNRGETELFPVDENSSNDFKKALTFVGIW